MANGALAGMHRALVVGLGRSGRAAAVALARAGIEVVATDRSSDPAALVAAAVRGSGVDVRLGVDGDDLVALLGQVDLVVPSPGVTERAPVLRRAGELGVAVWSEPELGFRLAPRRVVAITGTNGKTSVTELVAAMLVAAGHDAVACGNIGHPFVSAALSAAPSATLVAELSSFQLRFTRRLRPAVGVLLNLAPDHLDWHDSFEAYAAAKAKLWEAQEPGDWAVGNLDDPPSAALVGEHAPARVAWTSKREVPSIGVGLAHGQLVCSLPGCEGTLVEAAALPTAVPHHLNNLAAAACAALLAGADRRAVAEAARAFRPRPHRLEVVANAGGVTWVDDSKATNPHAAAAALRAFPAGIVWLAGGLAKGLDLGVLASELGAVRQAVLIGEAAADLARIAAARGIPVTRAATIEEAVQVAADLAQPGDTVLLAPACASFDQFVDYAERGGRFAAAARTVAALQTAEGLQ